MYCVTQCSAVCIVNKVIDAPAIAYAMVSIVKLSMLYTKQIDLTSVFVTIQQANVNVNQNLHNIQTLLVFGASTKSFKRTN